MHECPREVFVSKNRSRKMHSKKMRKSVEGLVALLVVGLIGAVAAGAPEPFLEGPLIKISDAFGSDVGPDADARVPSVAYNTQDGEFLAVWRANTRVKAQPEIFGQLLDSSGNKIGGEIQIATMSGGDDAHDPDVVYNPDRNEYMVIWRRSTGTVRDVFGQRLLADGTEVGSDDFTISDLVNGTTTGWPTVAYNSTDQQYMVVWYSNEGALSGQGAQQVWGQRLDGLGTELGTDFQISHLGNGSRVNSAAVAYNSAENQYFVTWKGDQTLPTATNWEVWAQLLNADGSEDGSDLRITDATSMDDDAIDPRVAYNSTDNEYLVAYTLTDADEIHGQRFNGSGSEIGASDFQISDKAAIVGSPGFTRPNLIHNPTDNEYLVVWRETGGVIDTFGQVVDDDGTLVDSQIMISDVQGDTIETNRDVGDTTMLAYNPDDNEYLTVWRADGPPSDATDGVDEIFGQRLIPEPTTMILLVGGALPALLRRKRS